MSARQWNILVEREGPLSIYGDVIGDSGRKKRVTEAAGTKPLCSDAPPCLPRSAYRRPLVTDGRLCLFSVFILCSFCHIFCSETDGPGTPTKRLAAVQCLKYSGESLGEKLF
ncbi:hypothetical protein EVAR_23656_1 [Eumeta japonica]|uniref:Uncharacterized protein n=1 Tax=Eumeta variegata TaxID=151549 RepID=A0A4C1VIP1_EUMVA|nr:hypothetical protein EVAR_23656_1 [Eumeta japonica]